MNTRSQASSDGHPLLHVDGASKIYPVGRRGPFTPRRSLRALEPTTLSLDAGRTLGIVGESGAGKSTLGRLLLGLERPTSGTIAIDGRPFVGPDRSPSREQRRVVHGVFQNAMASLNPRLTARESIEEPLDIAGVAANAERRAHVDRLMETVGLESDIADRRPRQVSGGQAQRISLARALALEPKLLVCDEPVSALDVSTQAKVVNLFLELRRTLGLAMVFIGHDLRVVSQLADEVAVMYAGRVVEYGVTTEVLQQPQHPYTSMLLKSIPGATFVGTGDVVEPREGRRPSPLDEITGCAFASRCPFAEERCHTDWPPLDPAGDSRTHKAACHFAADLHLSAPVIA